MKACEICGGIVLPETTNTVCSSCASNKESIKTSKDSLADHVCRCINFDRENCPLCNKPCHHGTSLSPKILITPM